LASSGEGEKKGDFEVKQKEQDGDKEKAKREG